jgi:hypothetical protein
MTVAVIVLTVVVIGLIGVFVVPRVVSRRTAAKSGEQLADPNAEAEAEILDGDWGVAPPSEPEQPAPRPQED